MSHNEMFGESSGKAVNLRVIVCRTQTHTLLHRQSWWFFFYLFLMCLHVLRLCDKRCFCFLKRSIKFGLSKHYFVLVCWLSGQRCVTQIHVLLSGLIMKTSRTFFALFFYLLLYVWRSSWIFGGCINKSELNWVSLRCECMCAVSQPECRQPVSNTKTATIKKAFITMTGLIKSSWSGNRKH